MGSLSPGQIALLIVAGLAVIGVIITIVRSRMTFSGYTDIAHEIVRLSHRIHGEVFRDGRDVVVSGSYSGMQTVVRFSNAENTPGLNVRMPAPTTFQLSLAHSSLAISEGGRIPVQTGREAFDARFTLRTDRPTEATLFLSKTVVAELQKLACSTNSLLSVGSGAVELSELVVPFPNTAEHVLGHLRDMAELITALRSMPGAERVKVAALKRERQIAGRIAIAVGVIIALGSIFAATKVPRHTTFSDVNATLSNGIPPGDAMLMRDVQQWRAATTDDFDPIAAAWLRNQGQSPSGRIAADFSGMGTASDVAYLLVGPEGRRRLAILANHASALDGEMVNVGLIARIPKSVAASIQWKGGKPPEEILGDGLLVVQGHEDKQTSVVFFLSSRGLTSGAPVDYQQISLQ